MITHSTLGERVHKVIRQDIIAGKYKPGERLFFESIAKETGVSMTPVKEAFMLLEREGLVVSIPRKGTFVRELSKRDIEEFYQIRLALESLAVDIICAEGLSVTDEEKLKRICDDLERHIQENDAVKCVLDDVNFHNQLVQASASVQLGKLVNTLPLTNLSNLVQRAGFYLQHGRDFLEEHRRILRLLRKREGDRIKEILVKHITTGDHSIMVALETTEE